MLSLTAQFNGQAMNGTVHPYFSKHNYYSGPSGFFKGNVSEVGPVTIIIFILPDNRKSQFSKMLST
jgi:hypothetical protein